MYHMYSFYIFQFIQNLLKKLMCGKAVTLAPLAHGPSDCRWIALAYHLALSAVGDWCQAKPLQDSSELSIMISLISIIKGLPFLQASDFQMSVLLILEADNSLLLWTSQEMDRSWLDHVSQQLDLCPLCEWIRKGHVLFQQDHRGDYGLAWALCTLFSDMKFLPVVWCHRGGGELPWEDDTGRLQDLLSLSMPAVFEHCSLFLCRLVDFWSLLGIIKKEKKASECLGSSLYLFNERTKLDLKVALC